MSGSLEQTGNLTPTYPRDQETIWREIRKLWAGINNRSRGKVVDRPFVLAGALYLSTSSRYYLRTGGTLQRVLMSLDVPGTTSTIVTLYKNTTIIDTVTLGAGADKTQKVITENFDPDTDYLRVGVTTVGTGAKRLDVQCRLLVQGD